MGVEYGTKEGTEGGDRAIFHSHRRNDKGVGPQKLNFLLRFDQNKSKSPGRVGWVILTYLGVCV